MPAGGLVVAVAFCRVKRLGCGGGGGGGGRLMVLGSRSFPHIHGLNVHIQHSIGSWCVVHERMYENLYRKRKECIDCLHACLFFIALVLMYLYVRLFSHQVEKVGRRVYSKAVFMYN